MKLIYDKNIIRKNNEALLLQNIINEKEVSRSDLAELTSLNKASVSAIVTTLIEKSLIFESHIGESSYSGGRRPVYLKFNPEAGSIISIDIGTDYINTLLTTLNGKIIKNIKYENISICTDTIVERLVSIITKYLKQQPKTPHNIVGIGVAVHGVVLNNNIRFTPNYSLDQINIHEELAKYFKIPIYIENEANLGALGEFVFSSPFNSLININIHSGVGAGIIFSDKILNGNRGYTGEIGHSILFPNGRNCPCGNKGCLERYISEEATVKDVQKKLNNYSLNIDDVIYYANNSNKIVLTILKEKAEYLSIGINNLISFYDPEIIIINSKIYNRIPQLINTIKQQLNSRVSRKTNIRNTNLNGNSTLYGCIALVLQNFLKIDQIKFD